MTRARRLPPIDETTVIPASRSRSASGKRPETTSHVCAVIFRFTEASGMQANPAFPLPEANDIALTTFFRIHHPLSFAIQST